MGEVFHALNRALLTLAFAVCGRFGIGFVKVALVLAAVLPYRLSLALSADMKRATRRNCTYYHWREGAEERRTRQRKEVEGA